jgi:hypothetical protein
MSRRGSFAAESSQKGTNVASGNADGGLEGRVARLATERQGLFDKASTSFGLSPADQERLRAVERELDDCFLARRQQRAERDANRFDRDVPFVRPASRTR